MYGPGRNDGYAKDRRYYEVEQVDYMQRAPGPGFRVARGRLENGGGGKTQVTVRRVCNRARINR
jgi:hypothetical protein